MRRALAAPLLLAGCHATSGAGDAANDAGARLERAAVAAGLVADPATHAITGSWANDTDRLCIAPTPDRADRIGVLIDYGAGLGCIARGTVARTGNSLAVDLGQDCRFNATFDGERIVFPPDLPGGCERLCNAHATLAALRVTQLSASMSEARSLRTPRGRPLCGD